MSKIFAITQKVAPRPDATIRVRFYAVPVGSPLTDEYRTVQLYEFHPDYDDRMKFRGYAYIKPESWMEHEAYVRVDSGQGEYVAVREFMIHEEDRQELYNFCINYNDQKSVIVRRVSND